MNQLNILRRLLQDTRLGFDSGAFVETIHRTLPGLLDISRATVLIYDEGLKGLIQDPRIAPRQRPDLPNTIVQPLGFSISGRCFLEARLIHIDDCSKPCLIPADYVQQLNLGSVIAAPIPGTDGPVGVLRIDSETPGRFSGDDIEFFAAIAAILGGMIENSRLFNDVAEARRKSEELARSLEERVTERTSQLELARHELEQRLHAKEQVERERHLLARFALDLVEAGDANALAEALRRVTHAFFGWEAFIFSERMEDSDLFVRVLACDTFNGVITDLDDTMDDPRPYKTRSELHEGKPLLLAKNRPSMGGLNAFGDVERLSESLMYAPIGFEGKLHGVLSVQSYIPSRYSQEDLDILVSIARIAAPALRRIQVERELKKAAFHDSLTGLPNRLLWMDRFAQCLARFRRDSRRHFAVLYLDVDEFKKINDSHGHLAGDQVLKEIAARLRRALRATDTVARMGGDEFVVLLEDLRETSEALAVGTRLLTALSRPMETGGGMLTPGISIGVAPGSGNYEDAEQILHDADKALYEAKEGGRGRCVVFTGR